MFTVDSIDIIINGFFICSIGASIPIFAFLLRLKTNEPPFVGINTAIWISISMFLLLGLSYEFASAPNNMYYFITSWVWIVTLLISVYIKAIELGKKADKKNEPL